MEKSVNFGHAILEVTGYEWSNDDKPIRHYILTIDQTSDRKLVFQAFPYSTDTDHAGGVGDMTDYAVGKLKTPLPPRIGPSPLDMKVKYQGWLLIQLDPAINWQFTNGEVPCTLKAPDLVGRNMKLRHVYDDGNSGMGPVLRDGCRTIFLAVVERDKPIAHGGSERASCFMNLNVEFLQDVGQTPTRLKIIIDPDVPNEGPESIP